MTVPNSSDVIVENVVKCALIVVQQFNPVVCEYGRAEFSFCADMTEMVQNKYSLLGSRNVTQ